MNKKIQHINHPEKISFHDVLFIFVKHAKKIIVLTLLGLIAATAVYLNHDTIYQSKAKLLVRYVRESRTVDPFEETKSTSGGKSADSVINTEIEILNSTDLAEEVAKEVGVDQLLSGNVALSGPTLSSAAEEISKGMEVVPGQSSNVLYITYGNKDSKLSKLALNKIIELYFKKHLEIHRSAAAFDLISKQAEEVQGRLAQTEMQLNKLRTESGILSLNEATGALSSQRAKTQEELMKARADFAERQASIESQTKASGAEDRTIYKSRSGLESLPVGEASQENSDTPPQQAITEYRASVELLNFLQKRDIELRLKFKSGNRLLTLNQRQLDAYDTKRRALLAKYPSLVAETEGLESDAANPRRGLIMEKAQLAAIGAKIEVYEAYIKDIAEQFGQQYAMGAEIDEVERRRQIEDAEYRSLEANLKNARLDQTLDPKRMPNITLVQQPSNPIKTFDKKIGGVILGLAGSGFVVGVGLAFLVELLLDRRVKRPMEIQSRLHLPLALSIPYFEKKTRELLMPPSGTRSLCIEQRSDGAGTDADDQIIAEPEIEKSKHFILPYSERIRDQIIFNFEVNNVVHKPKLIAVTGLSGGAGASTIAAGLAKSFSEIKGAKVLLVDLGAHQSEDHPIFPEIPRYSIKGALHLATTPNFKENRQSLYHACPEIQRRNGNAAGLSSIQLHELMPQLQSCDFDYIVFDMPTIDKTSRTLTMAGMMDKVLLVLDAENTSRDALMWGYAELAKGKADVSCIFNKNKPLESRWLSGDI